MLKLCKSRNKALAVAAGHRAPSSHAAQAGLSPQFWEALKNSPPLSYLDSPLLSLGERFILLLNI